MAIRVKVSQKFQVSVPSAARRKLHIENGDHLLVDVRDGYIVLMPEPRDYSQHLRGLHREIWQDVEPQGYVRSEREDWQK
ncbi:MAG: AbrB/MazE/SpoVT family DNA-binding domain-containing protein [Chloroflexi bacterium]|nr:AbrB/MazE/SpoVT family DNA-binding domain-containing protein [Chloroflexota bacterium]